MDDRIKTYQCENYRAEIYYNDYSESDKEGYWVAIFANDTDTADWEVIDLSLDFATVEGAEGAATDWLSHHRDNAESEIKEINN